MEYSSPFLCVAFSESQVCSLRWKVCSWPYPADEVKSSSCERVKLESRAIDLQEALFASL